MLKKFLVIFGIFLFSFISYLFLSSPTAMSVSQTNPNFWFPLSISITFLIVLLLLLNIDERKLAEKVGILKKIEEQEAIERVREVRKQFGLEKYYEELRRAREKAESIYHNIKKEFEKNEISGLKGDEVKLFYAKSMVDELYGAMHYLKLKKPNKVIRYLEDARRACEELGYSDFAEELWLLQGKMEVTYNQQKKMLKDIQEKMWKPFNE
ncbi:MAG: hypothetical protein QXS48_00320 [Candidatus Aenigmatarchaeota archaeon]